MNQIPINECAVNELDTLTDKIREAALSGTPLKSLSKEPENDYTFDHAIDKNTHAITWITQMHMYCPVCGHYEPWMKDEVSENEKGSLPEADRPVVYSDASRAVLWIRLKLQKARDRITQMRSNPQVIARAQADAERYSALLLSLTADPELERLNAVMQNLISEKNDLEVQKKAAGGLTKMSKKADLIGKTNKINKEIEKTQEAIDKEEFLFQSRRSGAAAHLAYCKALISGVSNQYTKYLTSNSLGYQLLCAENKQ
ncbi:MAG: hypothetical protein K6G61_11145 [Solobacterium sp.]|nr:hypothetical protein [Solobacterium sp.]